MLELLFCADMWDGEYVRLSVVVGIGTIAATAFFPQSERHWRNGRVCHQKLEVATLTLWSRRLGRSLHAFSWNACCVGTLNNSSFAQSRFTHQHNLESRRMGAYMQLALRCLRFPPSGTSLCIPNCTHCFTRCSEAPSDRPRMADIVAEMEELLNAVDDSLESPVLNHVLDALEKYEVCSQAPVVSTDAHGSGSGKVSGRQRTLQEMEEEGGEQEKEKEKEGETSGGEAGGHLVGIAPPWKSRLRKRK